MSKLTNVEVIETADVVCVMWSGRVAERRPGVAFEPLFERLAGMQRDLLFDLSGLEHISSTTLVVFMQFMKRVQALGLRVHLRYDEAVSWQRMSFSGLARLASGSIPRVATAA